jgi:hypothetical protein
MRYCNMGRQRYCPCLARCCRARRLSADRAGNAAQKPARKAGVLDHEDNVTRETDSLLEEEGFEPSVPPREFRRRFRATTAARGRSYHSTKRLVAFPCWARRRAPATGAALARGRVVRRSRSGAACRTSAPFIVHATGTFVPALLVDAVIALASALAYLMLIPNRPIRLAGLGVAAPS